MRLIGLNADWVKQTVGYQIFPKRFANGIPITIRSEPSRGGQRIIPGARIITAVIYKGYLHYLTISISAWYQWAVFISRLFHNHRRYDRIIERLHLAFGDKRCWRIDSGRLTNAGCERHGIESYGLWQNHSCNASH